MRNNGSGSIIDGKPDLETVSSKKSAPYGVINILVRAPNWLGDIMLSTPALTLLRTIYPDAVISVLVKSELEDVLSGNPDISELLTFSSRRPVLARLGFYRSLRKKQFDLAILFTNSFESALCSFIASARRTVGYNRDFRGLLLTHPVSTPDRKPPRIHQSEYYLNLVRELITAGIFSERANFHFTEKVPRKLVFSVPDSARDKASRIWEEEGLDRASLVIGFGPGAAFGSAKRWPPARYAELGGRIVRELGGKVVIFGSLADLEVSEQILSSMSDGAISLAGKSSIKTLGALLEKCDAYVTNDSGPMHIAAAAGTPVTAIFGPTDPNETSPLTTHAEIALKPASCAPCWKRECPLDHGCMESVSVSDVFAALLKTLRKKTDRC